MTNLYENKEREGAWSTYYSLIEKDRKIRHKREHMIEVGYNVDTNYTTMSEIFDSFNDYRKSKEWG